MRKLFSFLITLTFLFLFTPTLNKVFAEIRVELPSTELEAETEFNITISGRDNDGDDCYWVTLINLSTNDDITSDAPKDTGNLCNGTPNGDDRYYTIYDPDNGDSAPITIRALPAGEYEIRINAIFSDGSSRAPVPSSTTTFTLTGGDVENDVEAYVVSPNPLDINGGIYEVQVSFRKLTPGTTYKVCRLSSPVGKCREKEEADSFHVDKQAANGEINLTVCGDGRSKLKIEGCDSSKDYFHEGNFYGLHLYANDTTIISSLFFYVYHTYPEVHLNTDKNIVVKTEHIKDTDTYIPVIMLNDANHTPNDETSPVLLPNPLTVMLKRPSLNGGSKRNNFAVSLKGSYGRGSERCLTIPESGTSIQIPLGSNSGNKLLPGKYMLEIREQVEEGNSKDVCIGGGMVYYSLPVLVTADQEGEKVQLLTEDIKVDPNGIDSLKKVDDFRFGSLPCSKGYDSTNTLTTDTNKIVKCTEFSTAIGSFGVEPVKFIMTLGRWLLALGAVAAFLYIIYAGYTFVVSRGDKEKVGHAREILISAVTGLIFLVLSITILEIIGVDILHIPGFDRGNEVQVAPPDGGNEGGKL